MSSSCKCSQNSVVVKPNTGFTSSCMQSGDPTLNTMVFYIPEAGLELGVAVETSKPIYDRFIKFCNTNIENVDEIIVDSQNAAKYMVNGYTLFYDDVFHGVSVLSENNENFFFYAEIVPAWMSDDDKPHYWFHLVSSLNSACPDITEPEPMTRIEILKAIGEGWREGEGMREDGSDELESNEPESNVEDGEIKEEE